MRVLVTDHLHPLLVQCLEAMGYACTVEEAISNEEVAQAISDYDGLVVATKIKVTAALMDRAPRLRFVARAGSGMENIDLAAAAERDIACVNSPEGNCDAVGEHALAMLLALFNHLPRADREVRQAIFRREANRGEELGGKTVGIVGYGHTGQAFARRLAGFGVQTLAYDKYHPAQAGLPAMNASLDELYAEADVVSLHLPLTPENRYWMDAPRMAAFAKPFYLINTARGPIVDTAALLAGLDRGKVLGACLDVFENEHPERWSKTDSGCWEGLRKRENVVLSPHVAGWTFASKQRIAEVLADRIASLGLRPKA